MFRRNKKTKELELKIGELIARCCYYEDLIGELRNEIKQLRPTEIENTLNTVKRSARGFQEVTLVDGLLVFDVK